MPSKALPSGPSAAATWTELAAVLAVSTAVTVWWLWPLPTVWTTHAARFGSDVPSALADYYLIVWIMAWDTHALFTAPWRLFHANIFHPSTMALAYSDHLIGYVPLFAPWFALTGNPIFAANMVVFVSYPLCALAMYCLSRRWTGRPAAAVAGFLFAFDVWRFEAPGAGLHMLGVQYLPLAILCTERWFESARRRDAIVLAVALLLQGLSSMYLAYGLAAAYGAYLSAALWRWRRRLDRRRLAGLALACGAVGAVLVAVGIPYLILRAKGLVHSYGADEVPIGLVPAVASRNVWHYLAEAGVGPIGYALGAIALLPPWPVGRRWPVTVALLLSLVGTLAAFGPGLHVLGHDFWSPYAFFRTWVPGLSSVRLPSRFVVFAHAGFALLAGLGAARLLDRMRVWQAWPAAVGLVVVAVSTYGRFPALPLLSERVGDLVPPAYRWLAENGEGRVLLEMPAANYPGSARRMYFSTYHWLPMIDGYGGYAPGTAVFVHATARALPDRYALQQLVDWVDVGWVLVHGYELPNYDRRRWKGLLPRGIRRVATWGTDTVFRVTRRVREDRRARLLSDSETLGGVPRAPLGDSCPGEIRITAPPPDPWAVGSHALVTIEVENRGSAPWPAVAFYPRHLVRVRGTLLGPDGPHATATQKLTVDVAPGATVPSVLDLRAPLWARVDALEIELFQEDDGSLARCGVAPVRVPVNVQ